MIKTYHELKKLKTIEERYEYLKIGGVVGANTFGYDRYLNQLLYTSGRWQKTRNNVIIRDNGCDLGLSGFEISGIIIAHHINPVTLEQIVNEDPIIFDENYIVCTSLRTHNAIHYGDKNLLPSPIVERRQNDTCPWR